MEYFLGAGMENFPISTYPEDVQMNDYDVFILLTRGRFQENDKIILQEIEKLEKTCYFARTHTDVDLQEFAYDNPEIFNKDSWKEEEKRIKTKCYEKLENGTTFAENDSKENIFLISKYDFKKIKLEEGGEVNKITMSFSDNQRLKKCILECLPEFQKTALLFSMGNPDSLDLIQNKVEELKKRLVNVALRFQSFTSLMLNLTCHCQRHK